MMGYYLDKAKDLMKKAGIDCEKSEKCLLETTPLGQRYHLKYTEEQASQRELVEIDTRVHEEGFVLLWSYVLEDYVAFYRDEDARSKIPPGFVAYSEAELWELFPEGKAGPTLQTLRLIHEAKKHGGSITSS